MKAPSVSTIIAAVVAFALFLGWQQSVKFAGTLSAERDVAKSALVAARDTLTKERGRADSTLARVDTLWKVRTVTLARVDTLRVKGDSYMVVAHERGEDTARVCREILTAYQVRTSECDQLRIAVREDSGVVATLRGQVQRDTATFRDLSAQLHVVQVVPTCRVLFFLPCPSRTVMFFVGAGAGIFLDRSVKP